MRVVYRVDGGGWRGLGHVSRAQALVPALLDEGCSVVLATRTEEVLPRLARMAPTKLLVGHEERGALRALAGDVTVIDLPYHVPLEDFGRVYCVPRSHEGDWLRVMLRPAFAAVRVAPRRLAGRRVLVSGGGTDHHGLLVPLLEAVSLVPDVEPVILDGTREDVAALMATCAVGVLAYGVTALEAACVGLPTICVSPTDGHAVGAVALAEAGCSIHAGRRGVAEREVARILGTLLADAPARAAMSEAGRALIDGRGATRVAREIVCQA